jgi:hypothetical protein
LILDGFGEPNADHLATSRSLLDDPLHYIGFDALDRRKESPLVRIGFEPFINEGAVAMLPGFVLKRQCDEVTEPSPRHRVLIREQPVIGLHTQLVSASHRLGNQVAPHPSCDVGGHRRREEKPRMRAVSGTRAFDRNRDAQGSARLGERNHIFLPRVLVKVDREEPARFVLEQRITAHDVSSLQVIRHDLVVDRDEGLIHAITALTSGFEEAKPRFPFVRARRSVAGIARFLAHESHGENVESTSKQRPKQADLLGRRVRSLALHAKGEEWRRGCCPLGRSKLRAKQFDLCPSLLAGALELGDSGLLDGKFLMDLVFRAHHRHILSSEYLGARVRGKRRHGRAPAFDFVEGRASPGSALLRPAQGDLRSMATRAAILRSSQK